MKETQARLTEEFSAVARDYCDISWGKAIYVVGVLADSGLRRPESIYYNPKIRELSDPSSSLPEQAAQVFEVPKVDQVPLAPLKLQWTPTKILAKEKRLKLSRVRIRARTKKKDSSKPAENASDTAISQPEQAAYPGAPKAKA